jgi:AcrR family transcriptional regulator
VARQAVRDERRAQILDALYAVIATRGNAGASVSEIAEEAGIARGALHYFFASKDEIVVELMKRLGARYLAEVDAYVEKRRAKQSDSLVRDLAAWHFKGPAEDARRRMAVWIDFWGQAATNDEIRSVVFEVQAGARRAVEKAMLLDRPRLALLPDAALDAHAAAVLALIEGGLLQWRFADGAVSQGPAPRALPREQLAHSIGTAARAACGAVPLPEVVP